MVLAVLVQVAAAQNPFGFCGSWQGCNAVGEADSMSVSSFEEHASEE